jgi:MFS family permease
MLSFLALLIAIFVFKETRRPGARAAKEFPSMSRTAAVLRMPQVGALVLIYFLSIFSFANFEATLARLTESAFRMTDDDNFLVFAFIGLMLMFAGGLYRPLAKRLPETRLLAAGVGLMILGLSCVGFVAWAVHGRQPESGWPLEKLFYLAAAVSVAGFAFVNPSVSALISKSADPDRQGEVLGVNQSFASLGRILGPLLGSVLFSVRPAGTLPFVAAVAILAVVAALLPRVFRNG